MARYVKDLPMVAARTVSFQRVRQYLTGEKFEYKLRDGEQVFQRGKGFWVAPSFIKVTYRGTQIRVEAWVDVAGGDQDLEGVVAVAAKKPLKKHVAQVEAILSQVDPAFDPETASVQYCPKCGATIGTGGNFCPMCGTPAVVTGETPAPAAQTIPEGITRQEFFKQYAGESFYMNLKVTAICCYVLCGILGLTALLNPFALVDVAIYLGLTLGMHLGKSKGCAIGMLVYSILGFVVNLVAAGTVGGWGWLAVSGYAVFLFCNTEKRYKGQSRNT